MEIAKPLRIHPAYADRPEVLDLVRRRAPYSLMAAGAGYGQMMGSDLSPWFRAHWALDGEAVDPEAATLLHHPPFIEAARRLYGAEVVRPATLIVNLMGPMAPGATHVDTPTYRGLRRGEVPVWLLVTMGASGLFERWAVRVAGAITWFYEGRDGEFEYWPQGLDAASRLERAPFGNVAVIGDNDRMHHRVGLIGDPSDFAARARMSPDSALHARDDGGWEILGSEGTSGPLGPTDVRISLLWKAITFADAADARRFDEHEDDLDLRTIVSVFQQDLSRRGMRAPEPDDPFTDERWSGVLTRTYLLRE